MTLALKLISRLDGTVLHDDDPGIKVMILEWLARNTAVASLIATIILAFIGYMVTYVNNRLLARKKDQLELVNKRLNEFYGPPYIATQAGRIAYQSLAKELGKSAVFEGELSKEELNEWYIWVKAVFVPLNDLREKVIIENAHLIVEEQMPDCLLQFVTHVVGYKAVLAKWAVDDFSEKHSLINFPATLDDYVTRSYTELKHQQTRLLKRL
jgi:hypothetical protein